MSTRQIVFDYLDSISVPTTFSGWELQARIKAITGKNTYPSTILGYVRDYADASGSTVKCIDKKKSYYKFYRHFSLGNSILN